MELEQVKALLPESVLAIADLIGFPATAELLKVLGGTTFPIGKGMRAMGAARVTLLRDTIGDEKTRLLMAGMGGEIIYLPRCDLALRELRNRSFIRDFEALKNDGVSTPRIMTKLCPVYGFSDRFAWQLVSEHKKTTKNNQPSLF